MIQIPLSFNTLGLTKCDDLKTSINDFIHLLLTTTPGSCPCDIEFGFNLNLLTFENFNENEGTVQNHTSKDPSPWQSKKLTGNSKNFNTFAYDLCEIIKNYEKRLEQPFVTMSYIPQERIVHVDISGQIGETKEPYQHHTTIKIWN